MSNVSPPTAAPGTFTFGRSQPTIFSRAKTAFGEANKKNAHTGVGRLLGVSGFIGRMEVGWCGAVRFNDRTQPYQGVFITLVKQVVFASLRQ